MKRIGGKARPVWQLRDVGVGVRIQGQHTECHICIYTQHTHNDASPPLYRRWAYQINNVMQNNRDHTIPAPGTTAVCMMPYNKVQHLPRAYFEVYFNLHFNTLHSHT